jgi:threonine dehydrogenase-like Zn-dependent dehydrogenase
MKAVVCHGFGDSTIEEVPDPTPGPEEVLLEIERVQLSVTECNLYYGNEIAHYEAVRDRLASGSARLFGHEFCGTVLETGTSVDGFLPGERVYAPGKIPCHSCQQCRTGFELHCPNKTYIGYDIPGALAERAAFPAEALCAVPDTVSNAEITAMQPLASAQLTVDEAPIDSGDVVAVIGAGVMGYQCAQLATLQGAGQVIAVDVDPEKLDIAKRRGLTTVNAAETAPADRILSETDGIGADVVFEAVGGDQSDAIGGSDPLAQAFGAVRTGGSVVQVGYIIGDVTFHPRQLRSKSVDWINPVTGVTAHTPNATTGEHVADLVADDRVSIDEYITHELDGLERFEEAVEITMHKADHGARGPAQLVL